VVRPDGGIVRFFYDALGRRVSKSCGNQVTRWVWDGNVMLHEWTSTEDETDVVTATTNWLFDDHSFAPLAKLAVTESFSILTDHLGTPLQMHDQRGQQTWAAELNSLGQVRKIKGEVDACPFRYQGQYEDAEIGLYYNRFRYYDPETGVYISQDPIDVMGGLALYSYVTDPTLLVDAWGLLGEGDVARYGSASHRGDSREAHELLRNKYLQDNGLTGASRHRGNPSIALSPGNHDIAHAEEFRLRGARGLGNNEMMRRGKHEIRLASQAINNTLVQTGDVTIQQLRTARRSSERFAKKLGCY
jgi:RHS repeat-associated protein